MQRSQQGGSQITASRGALRHELCGQTACRGHTRCRCVSGTGLRVSVSTSRSQGSGRAEFTPAENVTCGCGAAQHTPATACAPLRTQQGNVWDLPPVLASAPYRAKSHRASRRPTEAAYRTTKGPGPSLRPGGPRQHLRPPDGMTQESSGACVQILSEVTPSRAASATHSTGHTRRDTAHRPTSTAHVQESVYRSPAFSPDSQLHGRGQPLYSL